jgi:hypothetical protein
LRGFAEWRRIERTRGFSWLRSLALLAKHLCMLAFAYGTDACWKKLQASLSTSANSPRLAGSQKRSFTRDATKYFEILETCTVVHISRMASLKRKIAELKDQIPRGSSIVPVNSESLLISVDVDPEAIDEHGGSSSNDSEADDDDAGFDGREHYEAVSYESQHLSVDLMLNILQEKPASQTRTTDCREAVCWCCSVPLDPEQTSRRRGRPAGSR